MEGEQEILTTANDRLPSGQKTPFMLLIILWSMGIIDLSPPGNESSQHIFSFPVVGSIRLQQLVFVFLAPLVFSMIVIAYFGAVTFFICYAGIEEHFLRFILTVVCYWPTLMSGSIFLLLAFAKNQCQKSTRNKNDVSWTAVLQGSLFLKRVSIVREIRIFPIPKAGAFLFFHLCGTFTSCIVTIFYNSVFKFCQTWLSYTWIASQIIGLTYLSNFSYFLYLQRIILEKEYIQTESFIEANAGHILRCTEKVKEFFCNYYRLRKLCLMWLGIILFSITFGVAVSVTWSYHQIETVFNDTNLPTPYPLHPEGIIEKACPYSCDDPKYLKDHFIFYNILNFLKLCVPSILALSVTKGSDIKCIWNRLILRLRLMSNAEDSDFWNSLIKYTKDLHPTTSMDTTVKFIIPVLGLAFGFLGGWKN